jgi:hypothetical protein
MSRRLLDALSFLGCFAIACGALVMVRKFDVGSAMIGGLSEAAGLGLLVSCNES